MGLATLPFDVHRLIISEAEDLDDQWALICCCRAVYFAQRLPFLRHRLDELGEESTILCLTATIRDIEDWYLAYYPLVVLKTEMKGNGSLCVHFGRVRLPDERDDVEELDLLELDDGDYWTVPGTLAIDGPKVSIDGEDKLDADEFWREPHTKLVIEYDFMSARGAHIAKLTGTMVRRASSFQCPECNNCRYLDAYDEEAMRSRWPNLTENLPECVNEDRDL